MSNSRMAPTEKVQEIAAKIRALQKLTINTGFRTTRSQGEILRTLSADELAAVAEILAAQPEVSRG